jgi:hypothetical protein
VSEVAPESLFSRLDESGRFHRDTPLGRIFHPRSMSFREISEGDSLHVSVLPGNRVSVHVDRISPLVLDPGGKCRYSLVRVLAHNLAALGDVLRARIGRRHGDARCHLDCELVWVPDEEPEAQDTGPCP